MVCVLESHLVGTFLVLKPAVLMIKARILPQNCLGGDRTQNHANDLPLSREHDLARFKRTMQTTFKTCELEVATPM